jgi:hypothetical protein
MDDPFDCSCCRRELHWSLFSWSLSSIFRWSILTHFVDRVDAHILRGLCFFSGTRIDWCSKFVLSFIHSPNFKWLLDIQFQFISCVCVLLSYLYWNCKLYDAKRFIKAITKILGC